MNVLVTGGAGYIGSHVCVELLNTGHKVIVIDNLSNSKSAALDRVREITGRDLIFYKNDLLDKPAVNNLFSEHKINFVIHLAGLKAVAESVKIPHLYYRTNITGTVNLCEAMMQHEVKNIVFSSSAAVYGQPEDLPILETTRLSPVNPYGRTKMIIEDLLTDIYKSDPGWNISILRYFNPVGAHESGKIGEDPNGIPNNLMPCITHFMSGRLDKLKVFGCDYDTKDGSCVRDYLHVVDLAKGHIQALYKLTKSPGIKIYNLGTGKGYSVLEVIQEFERATGNSITYEITGRRSGDVAESYTDSTLAKKELDWSPEKDLTEMCKDSWRWLSMNPRGYL